MNYVETICINAVIKRTLLLMLMLPLARLPQMRSEKFQFSDVCS